MFRNLKISRKLAIVVLVPLVALALVAVIGLRVLNNVEIGSSRYQEISKADALVADVLPPPVYLIQSRLSARELWTNPDVGLRAGFLADLAGQKTEYYARLDHWRQSLVLPSEREELNELEAAYSAGDEFWKIVEGELIPAVQAGDLTKAGQIDTAELNPVFEKHRSFIDGVTQLANSRRVQLEREANDTVRSQKLLALGTIGVLGALTLLASFLLARSISRPINRLTSAAQDAERELPIAVARAQAGQESTLATVDLSGSPEFGSLATAMNSMQATAVGLATEQARVRRNVSTMLGNLARRNQSLVNRTLSFITDLEKDERDPEALDNLFKLDHLTTRMRRNAESLLVLSGAEQSRTWPRPVEVREVLRAALSEIEAFDRVELASLHPALIRGSSVADLTHLVAELLDNATRFSPAETTVTVTGEQSGDGYTISIVDRGMGMSGDALAAANRELESLSRLEERTSLVLGLAVVGRLGARNGIGVRLEQSRIEGVAAKVRLPATVLHRSTSAESDAPSAGKTVPSVTTPPAAAPPTTTTAPTVTATATAASRREVETTPTIPATSTNGRSINGVSLTPDEAAEPLRLVAPESPVGRVDLTGPLPAPTSPAISSGAFGPPTVRSTSGTEAGSATRSSTPADPMSVASAASPSAAFETTASGLVRRVPGAKLFDGSLPPPLPAPPARRSAESVRDALSSFQDGYQRAPRRHPDPTQTDPAEMTDTDKEQR